MSKKIYEMVTQQIIEKLEKGVVPWKKPFQSSAAVNWKTQKAYRGINTFLLDKGEYATYKQIKDAGGKVKKGEKSQIIVFWKWLEKEDKESGEKEKFPLLRYYNVFEINTQVEGLESKRDFEEYEHNPVAEAEKIKDLYMNAPDYTFEPLGAWYKPGKDLVNVPPMKEFEDVHKFYSTLFHEMVHSTGHASRLNRPGITEHNSFGDESYSKEELVAELGASMLCAVAGIDNDTIDNSAAYIKSWLSALKDDNTLIVQASQQAQKASDYIQGIKFDAK